jgi:transposase-like protein
MSEKSLVPIKERVQQLYGEIRQIYVQYQKEVPKKRRPWPESIRSRILELWQLGVSSNQIALETGLPTQTMYSWRQRLKKSGAGFLPVPIIKKRHRRSNFDIQLSQLDKEFSVPTVTVVVGDLRVESVPVEKAAAMVREILRP